jgi:hypothetical protein
VDWGVLLLDTIPRTLLSARPLSLVLSGISGSDIPKLSLGVNLSKTLRVVRSAKCGDVDVIGSLLQSLIELSSRESVDRVIRSSQCGSDLWSVIRCGSGSSSFAKATPVILCVNCSDYCSSPSSQQSSMILSISCSSIPSSSVFGDLSMLYLSFGELFVAPDLLSRTSLSNRDTITISARLSGAGSFVCVGYLNVSQSNFPVSSDELILRGTPVVGVPVSSTSSSQSFSSTEFSATYSLGGLIPSSSYNVFCATLSSTLVPMSRLKMLSSLFHAKTACCRPLEVRLNQLLFDDAFDIPFALTVDVGVGSLSKSLVVSISVIRIDPPTSSTSISLSLAMFSPHQLTFTSTSSRTSSLTYVHSGEGGIVNQAGRYLLNVTLSGRSGEAYEVSFPLGSEFVVKAFDDPTPAPLLKRAMFSSDGSKVLIEFSGSTDEGSSLKYSLMFDCSKMFSAHSLQSSPPNPISVSGSRCVWTSSQSLEMLPVPQLNVGDVLALKGGLLRAQCPSKSDCSLWPASPSGTVTITAPSPALIFLPSVTVSIPTELGACDDLLLDLSSSSGSGGREWKSLSFKVSIVSTSTSPTPTPSSSLQNYLSNLTSISSTSPKSLSSLLTSPILVPNDLLSVGSIHTLEVELCNFLSSCGKRIKTFVVSASLNVPVVSLKSQNVIWMHRNSSLLISGGAYVSSCGSVNDLKKRTTTSASLKYMWSVWKDQVLQDSSSLESVSANPMQFKLPAYRLQSGSLYVVKLTVQHLISLKSSSVSVQVNVKSGDVVCVISSATTSSTSFSSTLSLTTGDELKLRLDESLLLDWSGSYDENLVGDVEGSSKLLYDWNCFRISPSYRSICDQLLVITSLSSSRIIIGVNASATSLGLSEVNEGDVFKLLMRVKSTSEGDFRMCERVLDVVILSSDSPVLKLTVVGGSTLTSTSSTSIFVIDPSSKLKVIGTIDLKSRGVVVWSVDDPSLDLSSLSLSPVSSTLEPSSPSSPRVMSLVIPGTSLIGFGASSRKFVLTLSCFLNNGRSASAKITIKTNSPPSLCVLNVDPPSGAMLETMFLLASSSCVDEDLPLAYQFGYFQPSLSSTDDIVVLRSKLELPYTSTALPLGSRESNFSLLCGARVFDSLDSFSMSSFRVMVDDKNRSASLLREYLFIGMNESRLSQNVDELKTVISLGTSVLNEVDCSSVPWTFCLSLNRDRCGLLVGTCGDCLSGFVGVSGPSNSQCISSTLTRRLLSSPLTQSQTRSLQCESDVDCADGLFLECNLQSHSCRSIQQTCPNSCSGHGICVLVSKYDPNVTVSECSVLDLGCVPRCVCEGGFVGSSSCSISEGELMEVKETRNLLLESVASMMAIEDADRVNVKSWVGVLSSLAIDYSQLGDESKLLLCKLCQKMLLHSLELGLSFEEVSGVEKVIDMSLSMSSDSTKEREVQLLLNSLLELYSELLLGDLVDGQRSIDVITPLFRTSSISLTTSSSESTSLKLSSPLSLFEQLAMSHTNSSQIQSITLPSAVSYPLRMSLLETLPTTVVIGGSVNASELSNSFGGLLSQYPCESADQSGGKDCVMRVELVNRYHNLRSTSNQTLEKAQYFEANCTSGVIEDHLFECPTGVNLTIRCDGSLTGRGRRQCPISSSWAKCKSMSESVGSVSGFGFSCELVSFSESSTICDCNFSSTLKTLSTRRYLSEESTSGDEGGGSVHFSVQSIGKSVLTEFVSTWEVAPALSSSDVIESVLVLVTMSSIVGLFIVLMTMTMFYDAHQQRNEAKEKALLAAESKTLTRSSIRTTHARPSRVRNLHQSRMTTLDESLPSIFKSNSLWSKFKAEMKVYHRWVGIVFFYSSEFPRSMRLLSLFSSIVMMLFVQAVTYNIADPDDGSCEACNEESCCLSLQSTLNSKEDRCYWDSSSDGSESCHFRDIGGDMTRMFIVAMISAIVSAPLALSVQFLITNVLSQSLRSDQSKEKPPPRLRSTRTTVMNDASQLSESTGHSVASDFKNLLDELSKYCEQLRSSPTTSPDSLDELKSAWGMMSEFQVLAHASEEDLIPQSISSRFLSLFSSREVTQATAQENLLKELSLVRKEVQREYEWFKEGVEKLFVDQKLCEEARKRRLLYLFVKDLSSGVSGDVLSNKSQIDSMKAVRGVTRVQLALGWAFVFVLNFGLLFYVYLFAMTQTHSRQTAWFRSFIMWFIFDLFIASTGAVLVSHLLIPLYVMTDIRKIKQKVLGDIISFQENKGRPSHAPIVSFNSAKFLFTSHRVASLFPDLPQSALILQFQTPWPKKSFKREKKKVSSTYERRYAFVGQAISRVLIFFLSGLIRLPPVVQEMLAHVASNSGLGYIVLLMIDLYLIHPLFPLVPIVALGLVVHFLIQSQHQPHSILPTPPSVEPHIISESAVSSAASPPLPRLAVVLESEFESVSGNFEPPPTLGTQSAVAVPSPASEISELIQWDDDSDDERFDDNWDDPLRSISPVEDRSRSSVREVMSSADDSVPSHLGEWDDSDSSSNEIW